MYNNICQNSPWVNFIKSIAFFIAALESSNFDLYNFIMNEQSYQEKRKGFYKALDQGINNLFVDKVWKGNGSEF